MAASRSLFLFLLFQLGSEAEEARIRRANSINIRINLEEDSKSEGWGGRRSGEQNVVANGCEW
jgi:hypothetical protein